MSNSQIDSSTNEVATRQREQVRQRGMRLFVGLGLAGVIAAIIFPGLDSASSLPLSRELSVGSAFINFVGAFLIYKRRLLWGVAVAASSALVINLFAIAQSSGMGFPIVVTQVFLYLAIFPLLLTEEDGLNRVNIGTVVVGAILILVDQFWPFPRQAADPAFVRTLLIFLGILVAIFSVVLARRFPTFSLRAKLIGATVLVSVVAVAVTALGVSIVTRNTLEQEVGNDLVLFAQSQGQTIGELMARQVANLESLALNRTLQEGATASNVTYTGSAVSIQAQLEEVDPVWAEAADDDPLITTILENELAVELSKYQRSFPENAEVFMTDQYGALVASTNRTSDFYQADEGWWQDAYNNDQGGIHIGEPEFDASSNVLAINIAVPIFASDSPEEIVGIMRTTYDLAALSDVLAAASFEETGRIDLYLPNGDEVTLNDDGDAVLQPTTHSDIISSLQAGNEAYTTAVYRGELSLVGQAPVNTLTHATYVDQLNWVIVASQSEAEGLASLANQQRFSIVMGVIVVIVVAGAAAFVGQRLTEPIINLNNVARQVSAGDLTAHADIESQDEIGTLAETFNSMTTQLRTLVDSLEQRVAERTRALEISGNVSRQLSNILEQRELVKAVVEQVQTAFDFYHAHIYLFDDAAENLIMVGGTGEAGQQMLANKHRIPAGKGLVGRAGQTGQPVLVPDTDQAEDWLPNPLLPDTKAEIAVPIMSGDKIWGVLDVQHNVTDGLSQADVDLLDSIANQVAVALRNANLYEEAQQQAKQEALMNEINQKILSTKDVQEAMQVAVREIGRALNASQTVVRFTQDDSGRRFGDTKPLPGTNGQQK